MFTFEHACSIKKFLSLLANNDQLKDIIVNNYCKIQKFLADRECEFFTQLNVNFDLIRGLVFLDQPKKICPERHQRGWKR